MRAITEFQGIFVHRDPVDMRKSINGLSEIVEQEKFPWPKKHHAGVLMLSPSQMQWLLDGYNIWHIKPFEKLHFSRLS